MFLQIFQVDRALAACSGESLIILGFFFIMLDYFSFLLIMLDYFSFLPCPLLLSLG